MYKETLSAIREMDKIITKTYRDFTRQREDLVKKMAEIEATDEDAAYLVGIELKELEERGENLRCALLSYISSLGYTEMTVEASSNEN